MIKHKFNKKLIENKTKAIISIYEFKFNTKNIIPINSCRESIILYYISLFRT